MVTDRHSDVAVVGASGRLGRRVVARLAARGLRVAVVGRSAERLASLPSAALPRLADCRDAGALGEALAGARRVVSCVHARFAPAILAALPPETERVVLVGSTRRFTRFTDRPAEEVRAAETLLHNAGRAGVILHPTMIYGADGENNVRRVAALVRRFPFIPLPRGGGSLIQPIHVEDVAACIEAAALDAAAPGPAIVIAGPQAVRLADFVRAVAAAMGRQVVVLSAPVALLYAAAWIMRLLPGLPRIRGDEIRRLLEDKAFAIDDMRLRLGVEPRPLAVGLAAMFSEKAMPCRHRSHREAPPC